MFYKYAKNKSLNLRALYYNIFPKFTFHTVSIDFIGPFLEIASGYKFLIIAIDKLTK